MGSTTLTVHGPHGVEDVRPELVCSCVHVRRTERLPTLWARRDCVRCGGLGRAPVEPLDYAAGSVSPVHLAALDRATKLLEEVSRER